MLKQNYKLIHQKVLSKGLSVLVIIALALVQVSLSNASVVEAATSLAPAAQAGVAIVNTRPTNLLAAPGAEVIAQLEPGAMVEVSGRSEDGQWVYGTTVTGAAGWVVAVDLVLFGQSSLPVLAVDVVATPASPTPTSQAAVRADIVLEPITSTLTVTSS